MPSDVGVERPFNLPPGVAVVDGPELHVDLRTLAQTANFAAVTTLLRDGHHRRR